MGRGRGRGREERFVVADEGKATEEQAVGPGARAGQRGLGLRKRRRASHAFHPLDGFLQSTPYHMYAFLFPMNKVMGCGRGRCLLVVLTSPRQVLYLGMFIFVNMWTISIHDGWFVSFDGVINRFDSPLSLPLPTSSSPSPSPLSPSLPLPLSPPLSPPLPLPLSPPYSFPPCNFLLLPAHFLLLRSHVYLQW
eukprot:438818-Hanusia_phi.AAC.1